MTTKQVQILIVCYSLLLLGACQSLAPAPVTDSIAVVPLNHLPALSGDYFKIDSRAVGRPYHIYVRLPQAYDENPDQIYPVVYVLDGDSLFPILAANHLFLNFDDNLPEVIVVGIAYGAFDQQINKRGMDFSAPAADARPGQGGAPHFQAFLKSELIPKVETRYRADPARRILFGQSRGGYMVLYSAFTDPDVFWGHIANNPVFDPGRDRFFALPAPAARNDLKLLVSSGSRERPDRRAVALKWFTAWANNDNAPWSVKTLTIEGGTHAANSTDSYRAAMNWLFDPAR